MERNVQVIGTTCHGAKDKFVYYDMLQPSTFKNVKVESLNLGNAVAIICNAITSIDKCYLNQEEAYKINVLETLRIIQEFNKWGIKTVFLSSEAVFDGKKGYYTEIDDTFPVTIYGRYKEIVEKEMIEQYPDNLIIRISRAATGVRGDKDIFNDFYSSYVNKNEIRCIKNQTFTVTAMKDIVYGILHLIDTNQCGIWHISNNEMYTRKDIAELFFNKLGIRESVLINEYDISEMNLKDNRHIYAGLNGEKFSKYACYHYEKLENMIQLYIEGLKQIKKKGETL